MPHAIRRALLLAALLLAPNLLRAQRPSRAVLVARIDSLTQAMMAEEHVPGVSVAVLRGQDTIRLRGYGMADVENSVPASTETVYRIGSITKQFTALIILQLAREGRLSLDDTLQKFVPSFPTPGRRITVRNLLNHTSGIPNYTSIGRAWLSRVTLNLDHDSLLALVKDLPPDFAPGEQFRYDNTGYYLLGMVIESVTGHRYADEVATRITGPLHLGSTMYCGTRQLIPHRAQGYTTDSGNTVTNASYLDMGQPFAAGALCSTTRDLLVWHRALSTDALSPLSYEMMSASGQTNHGRPTGYGMGLAPGDLSGHRRISHSGGIYGFSTDLANYPDDSLVIVVLANSEDANATRLSVRIARAALGIPEPVVRDLPLSAADRARFEGSYRLTDALTLRVFSQGDSLMSQATGQSSFRLLYQGEREFRPSFDNNVRVVFEVDASGRATTLILYQGGERRAPRVN